VGLSYDDADRLGIGHLHPLAAENRAETRRIKAQPVCVLKIDPNRPRSVLYIPDWHPARLNQLLGHWAVAAGRKARDRETIARHCELCGVTRAMVKRRVTLVIGLAAGQRGGDVDAYWKGLLDSLVQTGAIKNDSPAWVELAPVAYTRGVMGTTIILEDAP